MERIAENMQKFPACCLKDTSDGLRAAESARDYLPSGVSAASGVCLVPLIILCLIVITAWGRESDPWSVTDDESFWPSFLVIALLPLDKGKASPKQPVRPVTP
jgi:hypothetical protein